MITAKLASHGRNNYILPQLVFACFMFIFLTGCLTPRKLDKWMVKHYGQVPAPIKKKSDYLDIKSTISFRGNGISTSTKKTSNVLPLLFYWRLDYKNTCTLNPQLPVNTFTSTVHSYASAKGLKKKLNGQRIELSIDSIPNIFAINDEGHLIWFSFQVQVTCQKRQEGI